MFTQESLQGPVSGNPSQIIQRLERINRELVHLKTTLRSYLCEPKTYRLFERCEFLKGKLERMHSRNLEVIQSFKLSRKLKDEELKDCRETFSEYHTLEQQVLEYVGMAKSKA